MSILSVIVLFLVVWVENNPSKRPEVIAKLILIQNDPERIKLNKFYAANQTEEHKSKLLLAARNKSQNHIASLKVAAKIQGNKNVKSGHWKECNRLAAISNKQTLTCNICKKLVKRQACVATIFNIVNLRLYA